MRQDGLTASETAQLLGVAITTLRTWDRRYGLGPEVHEAGKHRRYREPDVQRLMEMRRLIAQGVPPGQAAAWVLNRVPAPNHRDGGGHAVAVGASGPAVRGLTRAAMRLDSAECRRLIIDAIASAGVVSAWTDLLSPALIHIGAKHAVTRGIIDVEHLLSTEISFALAGIPRPPETGRILLACADEEQHSLALEAVSAALAQRGIASRLLGARVPLTALRDAIRRTGPDVVVLWSQTADTAHSRQLPQILRTHPTPRMLVAAGPGWDGTRIPGGIARPTSLAEAVAIMAGG
jgi:hypothetical protein